MKINTVILIGCWFGNLPTHFPAWLVSAKANSKINFLVITDQVYSGELPANVKIINCTRAEFSKRVSKLIGLDFTLGNAYKVCDLRLLLFGMFPELITDYDWWGYCDLDVIWGDLSLDLTEQALNTHDKIGKNGHCSLWRSSKFSEVFSTILTDEYRRRLADSCHNYALDEHMGLGAYYSLKPRVHLFRHELNCHPTEGRLCPVHYFSHQNDTIFWQNGQLIWREFTKDGYYDTSHSYIHLPRQRIAYIEPATHAGTDRVMLVTYGKIEWTAPERCDIPTNLYSRKTAIKAQYERYSHTLKNRLRGGTRGVLALGPPPR